jgi:cytochrome c peroxidase
VARRLAASLTVLLAGCAADLETWDFGLPEGVPTPQVPADNPMSEAKVELGRRLFYDPMLSANGTQSCGSCHDQARAFTDGLVGAVGSTGQINRRNAMSLTNVAYVPRLNWANPIETLEEQARGPLFGTEPVELGLEEAQLLERLNGSPDYVGRFAEAFPEAPEPVSVDSVLKALAAFQRTLVSADSPYDRLVYGGQEDALSDSARRGAELFFGERLECFHCHGGFSFTDSQRHDGTTEDQVSFHNTGLYNVDGRGGYPASDTGLFEITGDRRDMGRFRAPTLRNIAVTAPYFHDGSAATLDEVLDHYAAGGRTIAEGENAGVGSESPLRSLFVSGFTLTAEERADVLAFLESLTDETFLSDPRFADPFAAE